MIEHIYAELKEFADSFPKRNFESDDIINDLFIHLHDNPEKAKVDLLGFSKAFIYHQIKFAHKDEKHKYNNLRFVGDDVIHNYSNTEEVVEEKLTEHQEEQLLIIKKAKESMDADMLLMYHYYYECNYTINREIADIIGRSVGDAHSRVDRMRKHIESYKNNNYQTRIPCEVIK